MAKKASTINHDNYIKSHSNTSNYRNVESISYQRNTLITQYIKQLSKGKCALCKQDAPFIDKNDMPFLHVHHIEYLSNGGEDTIDNCVVVCPNCHAKIHNLESSEDKQILLDSVADR